MVPYSEAVQDGVRRKFSNKKSRETLIKEERGRNMLGSLCVQELTKGMLVVEGTAMMTETEVVEDVAAT